MKKYEITLSESDIEEIVRNELLYQYKALSDFPSSFIEDDMLICSLARVLRFYGASEEDLQVDLELS